MKQNVIRIATRKSPLALAQAEYVKHKLLQIHPELKIELMGMLTEGDKLWATPLPEIGGKSLFVKELEIALLERKADIAVHSIKDLPAEIPDDLTLAVICERNDPRDAFISLNYSDWSEMPGGAIVGTSSLRRQCQLQALRPDLKMESLRGNVGTRLQKLADGHYDAIILAAAGLQRLAETAAIRDYFIPEQFLPAIGQGAIGIECRKDDSYTQQLIAALDHKPSRYCITAERAVNQHFGGNCQIPLAAYATLINNRIHLHSMIGKVDGSLILRSQQIGNPEMAADIGKAAANDLIAQGALEILREL